MDSSLHQHVHAQDDRKKKPDTILTYNVTKCGLDTIDQMARLYTTKAGTRRWPVAVFYNILDLDLYNILDLTSMRQFVDQLVNMRQLSHIFPAEIFFSSFVLNLVQKVVQHSSEENLSVVGPCKEKQAVSDRKVKKHDEHDMPGLQKVQL